jgi:hypothetical protein
MLPIAPDQVTQVNPDPSRIRIQTTHRRDEHVVLYFFDLQGHFPVHFCFTQCAD